MNTRRSTQLLLAAAVVVALASCTDGGDKAGGPGKPVVLTMANGYAHLDYKPAVRYFVARIAEL
jgi:hypothetical protein